MPVRRTLACTLAALLLTACTDTQPTESTTPVATTTTAAAEPALELGDFDPEGTFTVFDPCTEIPADVLAEAGLVEGNREPYRDAGNTVSCYYDGANPDLEGFFVVTGDRVVRAVLEERGFLLEQTSASELQGLYLHHMGSPAADECSAAVHTTRGRVVVDYVEPASETGRDAICARAVEKLEIIIQLMGDKNGNAHRS